ncbi:MAG: hypothetical protein ABJA16_11870 [Nakamurella sp.]
MELNPSAHFQCGRWREEDARRPGGELDGVIPAHFADAGPD